MTSYEKKKELVNYRLNQAQECIDDAEYLFKGSRSPRSVMNRIYYSMFYSVLALLVYEDYASSKHSGVISYFNQRFLKEGKFPDDPGRFINKAFELRQMSDYRENVELTLQEVEPYISKAKEFIEFTKKIIKSR